MNKTEKQDFVKGVRERLLSAQAVFLADFRGLKVSEAVELRRRIRKANGSYQVIKNTLIWKAIGETKLSGLKDQLHGETAVTLVPGDPVPVAKVLVEFSKTCPPLKVKGAFWEDRTVTLEEVRALAALPDRGVLLSMLVGAISAPLSGLLNVLQGVQLKLLFALKALEQKRSAAPSREAP